MEIHSSAYRHGLDGEAITHAWNNAVGFYDIEPDYDPTERSLHRS